MLSSQLVHASFDTNYWSNWSQYKAYSIIIQNGCINQGSSQLVHASFVTNYQPNWSQHKAYGMIIQNKCMSQGLNQYPMVTNALQRASVGLFMREFW